MKLLPNNKIQFHPLNRHPNSKVTLDISDIKSITTHTSIYQEPNAEADIEIDHRLETHSHSKTKIFGQYFPFKYFLSPEDALLIKKIVDHHKPHVLTFMKNYEFPTLSEEVGTPI